MIYDLLTNAALYSTLHPRLKQAYEFLQQTDLEKLEPGRFDLDGDALYVLVQEYAPKPLSDGKWEAHHRYMDVQFMLRGCERIDFGLIDHMQLGEYIPDKDFQALDGQGQTLLLEEGSFVIFFPQDAHMPGLMTDNTGVVKKIVVKCLI